MSANYELLKFSEDNWITSLGAWYPGEKVILRNRDLLNDLSKKSWMEIWLFSITGREFSGAQIELWNRLWIICSSFPEPRIWNNRVAALGGTARTTGVLALSSATAVSEASIYGRQADYAAFDFICRMEQTIQNGSDIWDEVKKEIFDKKAAPPGYGRPVISVDERIPPVIQLASELGFDEGPHFKLALKIEQLLLQKRYRFRLNVGGIAAALSADQGLSLEEYYCFVSLVFSAGNIACFIDSSSKPPGTLFPLRCSRISYIGAPSRKWEK